MTSAQSEESHARPPYRLWPGVVVVVLQWLVWLAAPLLVPGVPGMMIGVSGGFLGGLGVLLWWLFFSRAPWSERLGASVLMIFALLATSQLLHESVAKLAMGMLFGIYAVPVLSLAFVAGALAGSRLSLWNRRVTMAAAILVGCGVWTLLRADGITGDTSAQFAWRWTKTPEELLLDRAAAKAAGPAESFTVAAEAEWPGFRGPLRDSVVRGVEIETDWSASPPTELWRRAIGPAWSSFAVAGEVFYTQEQRGDEEVVACYQTKTGQPVWQHRDPVRFWEANSGAGPRATPTLIDGRLYTFGGTGILNALNASDGTLLWSRNAASDCERDVPYWGFASSPLVVGDLVLIAASGQLVAYDTASGDLRWMGRRVGGSFSSPHLMTLDDVAQVLLVHGTGATGVAPADGTVLWEHSWPADSRVLQPALTPEGDILIGSGFQTGVGMRRISVASGPGGWTTEERWTSNGLKPYFNDFVVHEGHAFGFDGRILSCIDLKDGQRKWKGGRYGYGQLILLPGQDLLLVLSEEGELVLVEAAPERFKELARSPAIEGKTWNHPVLVGDLLLVRNSQEMAAFRLSLAGG